MNEHLTPASESLEKERRAEIVSELLRDSEGSVALNTSADFAPEDRQALLAAQSERIGEPAEILNSDRRGWGDYGERPAVDSQTSASQGENVRFVTLENGDVDIRYNFSQNGYSDGSGRPGNSLNVQFVVRPENAVLLQQSLDADPSFINEVIEAQVKAIGVSERHWKTKMKPHYEDKFVLTVEDKDRVLNVSNVDVDETVSGEHALLYGENKSLVFAPNNLQEQLQYTEPSIESPPAQDSLEQGDYLSDEEWEGQVERSKTIIQEDVNFYTSEGKTPQEIITLLGKNIADDEAKMMDPTRSGREQEVFSSHGNAGREMVKKLEQQLAQESQALAARQELEQVFETVSPEKGQVINVGGENIKVADTYQDASGKKWLELTDGRQVMASKVTLIN